MSSAPAQKLLGKRALVTAGNGRFNLADEGADTRATGAIALGTLFGLADALARRSIVRHGL